MGAMERPQAQERAMEARGAMEARVEDSADAFPGLGDIGARAEQILLDVFGYGEFRGDQKEIVTHLAGGGDALVLMPTGGGKSLCYQIPSLLRDGIGVVVSPLIALMQDQVAALEEA